MTFRGGLDILPVSTQMSPTRRRPPNPVRSERKQRYGDHSGCRRDTDLGTFYRKIPGSIGDFFINRMPGSRPDLARDASKAGRACCSSRGCPTEFVAARDQGEFLADRWAAAVRALDFIDSTCTHQKFFEWVIAFFTDEFVDWHG